LYKTLTTNDPSSFSSTNFLNARLRHWLDDGGLSSTLSIERAPSPDGGITEGASTWYDYENKTPTGYNYFTGDTDFPSFIASLLPDGSTRYTYALRGTHVNVTNFVSTYTALDGSRAVRTNIYIYTNDVDLIQWIGPRSEQVLSNYFSVGNTLHRPDAVYDALSQATLYTYNGYGQIVSVVTPAGLTTTYSYFPSGDSVNRLSSRVDIEILATNTWTYANGLVSTHTDPRGLTVTNFWDGLHRLTNAAYPDGSIVNVYTNLDIAASKDRLGKWRYFGYNSVRQLIAQTNAWSTTVAQVTTFDYDNQGNRTFIYGPDGYNVTNWYDSLGRLVQTSDGTTYRNFYFNNQGLVTNVSNSAGPERKTVFDIEDRPIWVTDINGVTVANTYDDLNRLLTRTYPDGGVEKFGYSARGMIAYTNQIGATNFYAYDEAMRKTVETNANGETIRYTNSAAGDLLSLTDGKSQTVRWGWDEYGRTTNKTDQAGPEILRYKYDANGRLTNRWSAEKGNTGYLYDDVGNLTRIDYPSSTDVSFRYDCLNRVSNMVDAVGTTIYSYTAGNQLLTEDGPFASDVVTNAYHNRLRTQLSLQQSTGFWTNGFTYDNGARLSNVLMSAGAFVYNYPASSASRLTRKLTLPNTSFITNIYDGNARLTSAALTKNDGTTVLDSYAYVYDRANERTNLTRLDGSTVGYLYDKIGQLTVADSSVAGEDRGYKYDAAWNLNWLTNSGTATRFDVNVLNELTNGPIAANSYDANGNLTNNAYDINGDATILTYDDENRLVDINNPLLGLETVLVYDGLGRLRVRQEYTGNGQSPLAGGTLTSETHYIYDRWRVIQERNGSNVPQVTYTRGSDLSGSMEGAGGIGGLLARSHGYSSGTGNWSTHNYYFADGNGNITYLANSSQALAASYRYDPFGNTISSSGSLADINLYRFSSQEVHVNSGMYYYGYRFYDPGLARWINTDPILEAGGINLYAFLANRVPNRTDPFGLADGDGDCPGTPKDLGDNCYQYACGKSGRNSDIVGAAGGDRCSNPQDCDAIKKSAIADGLGEVPADGNCPANTHKVGYAKGTGNTKDYHWFRGSKDGKSWCYKFRGQKPSNLDGNGNPITDPKPDDNFAFRVNGRDWTYSFCGFLCAPDTY
jgi:RHS repeat-associated protein